VGQLGYWNKRRRSLRRRDLLKALPLAGWEVGLGIVGCGDDDDDDSDGTAGPGSATSAPTETPVRGGTLRFANWSTLFWADFLDPIVATPHAATWTGGRLYLETLTEFAMDGSVKAALAEKWTIDATGTGSRSSSSTRRSSGRV
jgi:ABC-type transport system substrate-binding protein